jgi:hypothetical protein
LAVLSVQAAEGGIGIQGGFLDAVYVIEVTLALIEPVHREA